MLSMCAMRSSLAAEASCSVFAYPEVGVLYQCSIASPIKYTFWRIMEWRYNKKSSCRLQQDELGSAKDNGSPINGLSLLLHLFNQSLYLLLLFVNYIHENKKIVGRWLVCPLPCYVVWNLTLPFFLNWRMRLQLLFMSASFWSLDLVSSVWGIYEIAHLSALVDIKSLEVLASIELGIDDMIFHNWKDYGVIRKASLSRLVLERPAVAGVYS